MKKELICTPRSSVTIKRANLSSVAFTEFLGVCSNFLKIQESAQFLSLFSICNCERHSLPHWKSRAYSRIQVLMSTLQLRISVYHGRVGERP